MKKYPKLDPAPIAEAVFCVDFAGLPQLTQASVNGLMQMIDAKYVKQSDLVARSLQFDLVSPQKEIKPESIWSGVRFQNGDFDVAVLSNLTPQVVRFSYSRLSPYTSWDEFIDTGRRLIDAFVKTQRDDPIVKRVGIRYINHIDVQSGRSRFADILTNVPADPRDISGVVTREFFCRDNSYYEAYGLSAISIKCNQRNPSGKPVIVADFDVFDTPEIEMSKIDWIDLLERAHKLKNALFFGTVAKKAYSRMIK